MRRLAPLLLLLTACADGPDEAPPTLGQTRQAVVLELPGQFDTLQDALNAARPGDTIRVGPGDFGAGVTIEVEDLTIEGPGPALASLRRGINVRARGFTLRGLSLIADGDTFGVHARNHGVRLEDVDVSGFNFGVAVFDTNESLVVDRCTVRGNNWGFYLEAVRGRVANSLILNNTGAGFFARANVGVALQHSTVVGNGFANPGDASGGVVSGPAGTEQVRNNIIVGNHTGVRCASCTASYGRNLVWGNVEDYADDARRARDDLSADPLFVAPAARDFRLRAGSPAIDAGLALGERTDAGGDGRPAGAAPDLGAYEFQPPTADVRINEVMANPLDETSGEFVELINAGDAPVDLAGYRIDDGDDPDVIVGWEGGDTVLAPGAYAVVVDPDFPDALPAGALRLTVGDTRLGNGLSTGDPVALRLPDGNTVVSAYEAPFDPGNGVSAEWDGAAFVASPCGSSPGADNCAGAPPPGGGEVLLLITEVMANPLDERTGEYVELMNLGEAPVDLAGFVLSDGDSDDLIQGFAGDAVVPGRGGFAVIVDPDYDGAYDIPAGAKLLSVGDRTLGNGLTTSDPVTLRDPAGELVAAYLDPFDPGDGRSAELPHLEGGAFVVSPCDLSPGRDNCAWGVEPPDPQDAPLRITEVMANALDEDTGEFVELFNAGAEPIDAAGLVLSDGDATDVLLGFGGGPSVIPPGGYAVILDPEYAGEYALPGGVVRLQPDDTTLGSGLATADVVEIRAADGATVLDAFTTPFNPGNGVSAEWDGAGWVASTCPAGASPGRRNCAQGEAPPEPGLPRVIINEVMANPLDERRGEFVELWNLGEAPVDLAGFVLYDGDAADPLEGWQGGATLLPAGGFAVVLDRDYDEAYPLPAGALRLTVDDASLGTGLAVHDTVELLLPDGVTVLDRYAAPFDPGNGTSAERTAPDRAEFVAAACPGDLQASPGRPNCAAAETGDPLDCRARADCADGWQCIGIPQDGSTAFGRCADIRNRPGENADCPADLDCGEGLVCAGLSSTPGGLFCLADYHHGVFTFDTRTPIPDGAPAGVTVEQVVYGLGSVPLDIFVELDIDHPAPAQLRVTLVGASTDSGVLFDGAVDDPALLGQRLVARGIPGDDVVNGRWRLEVVDTAAGGAGHLNGWTLDIISRWD